MEGETLKTIVSFPNNLRTAKEFFFSSHKYSQFFGGIRNSKTTTACKKVLSLMLMFPGNRALIGRDTYPNLMDTTAKVFLDEVAKLNGAPGDEKGKIVKRYDKTSGRETLYLHCGSEVRFRYLMKFENVQGAEYGVIYVDEADQVPEETYDMLESRLTLWTPERVKDFIEKYGEQQKKEFGHIIEPKMFGMATGNPHPGWVKRRFKEKPSVKYKLFEAGTDENRENLPPGYIEEQIANHDQDWVERFINGNWDVFKGQVYKDYDKDIHVIKPFNIPKHWNWNVALDYGSRNPTSVHWRAIDEKGRVYTVKEFYKGDSTVDENAPVIKKIFKDLEKSGANFQKDHKGRYLIWADKSTFNKIEGVSIADRYLKHGIILLKANDGARADVVSGIEVVKSYLRPKAGITHPETGVSPAPRFYIFEGECPCLEWEFPLYEYVPVKPGEQKNANEEPKKWNDHAMDETRYSLCIINDAVSPEKESEKEIDRDAIITSNAFKDDDKRPAGEGEDWVRDIFGDLSDEEI